MNGFYGCLRDTLDHRDQPMTLAMGILPSAVDLRQWAPPVLDQGPLGSCTANAVTAAARWHIIRRGTTYDFPMSRLQLYYDSRALEGTTASDGGAQIRDVIKTLAKKGVGHEDAWPYVTDKFAETPPPEVYADAQQYKALTYQRVPVTVTGIKTAVSGDHPVVIGVSVYESFENVGSDGIVPMPEKGEALVGGHALLVLGYGQKPGYFTVRNSWGADDGDHGDRYFPEAYLGSPTYCSDFWLIDLFGTNYEQKAGVA